MALGRISDCHHFCCRFLPFSGRLASHGGSDELYQQYKPTGEELTVLPSSSCSQRLITWLRYKHLALYATFFFFLQTTLKGFISRIPFFGDFYFKTLKRNSMLLFLPKGNWGMGVKGGENCSSCVFTLLNWKLFSRIQSEFL